MDTQGKFYLGRIFDPQQSKLTSQALLYDPADLTTHAVVVGMTGSGKTGLCIGLLEEAALNGIPALMIDPKGDIANALLHFPNLAPADFKPWVNPDDARRDGKTVEQAAVDAATQWQKGLADWEITPDRLKALQDAAQFAIYTPGSDAGIPVSILASLKAPPVAWEKDRELLREKISSTVTALLGLVGMQNIDPVRSREHILLSNIFEQSWREGQDLDLSELILQTQSPPFAKLGVFDVNTFFPEKDRFELAMLLNNIMAAPSFATWIEGQPLDVPSLLWTPDGRPRHSVFYIAHLEDAERMFFVTLLYSAIESWMRSQPGTSSLRAILYFDEIFGYLPPTANPPSKSPMLRMLKQARAFGIGQVLVTQNPVDVDYKALSNAGSWFIGKLQTDQDKQRLLDGLQSAMSGGLDRSEYDRLISALGKRVFLLHNVHAKGPQLFGTRWAMNYLAGPLTRTQIPPLNQLAHATLEGVSPDDSARQDISTMATAAVPTPEQPQPPLDSFQPIPVQGDTQPVRPAQEQRAAARDQGPALGSTTRPAVPSGIPEYFLPNNQTVSQALQNRPAGSSASRAYASEAAPQGLIYRPSILAQASLRFLNRKYNLDCLVEKTALVTAPDRRGMVRWDEVLAAPIDSRSLDTGPAPQARFASLEAPLNDVKILSSLEKDFLDWAYRSGQVTVQANEALKQYAGPEISTAEFRKLCADTARQSSQDELEKLADSYDKKIDALQVKLAKEQRELSEDESEHSQRKIEELGSAAETIIGLFGRRKSSRRLSSSLSKRRMTEQAKADVKESREAIEDYQKQIAALEQEKAQAQEEVSNRWGEIATQVSEIPVAALKKDVLLDLFGVAWVPYHVVKIGPELVELPGFSPENSR